MEVALDLVDAGVGWLQAIFTLLELFLLELEKVETERQIDFLVQCLE